MCTLGEDAFENVPAVIKETHTYLKNLFNERELAGGMMLQLIQDVNTMSLDRFQVDILATRAQYERSDAILGGMGVGWTPSFLSTCYSRASRNLIASFVKDIRKLSIGLILALYRTFGHENFVKGPANLFTDALADLRLDGLLTLITMTYGRLGDLFVLLSKERTRWQGERVNAKQYCGMPLLTDLAVIMRIDPLALVYGLREFVKVVYGPVMSYVFPDVQVKAYRNSLLNVNLVSVVDCSVLNWVEQKELRGLASDDRLFGRIVEPGWMLMDFNNNFKCRIGGEDLSLVQFNPKLWNLQPVVKVSGEAMRVPLWPEAYAHVKENQQVWFSGSRPLPDQYPRYPPECCWESRLPPLPLASERLVMRKRKCGNGVKGWSRSSSVGNLRPCILSTLRLLMHGAGRRSRKHLPGDQGFPLMCGMMCTRQQMTGHGCGKGV